MTRSDKTRKYTHAYNGIYLLFCRRYSNSVSFIELIFCLLHGEACVKILCSEKELLNLKDSKLTQNFYSNKTGFVRPGHIYSLDNYVIHTYYHDNCSALYFSYVRIVNIFIHTLHICTDKDPEEDSFKKFLESTITSTVKRTQS